MQYSLLLSPFLLLVIIPPSFPVSEYDLPPSFQWQGHQFGLLWIAVGWSFVILAAAVLSLRMVHMARGQGSGSVRTTSMSGCSTNKLLLVSFGKTAIMHCTHQSPDKYTVHRVALYSLDLMGIWHMTNFETVWVCTFFACTCDLRLNERWEVSDQLASGSVEYDLWLIW